MLSIPCPSCGPREENEFRYGGWAGVAMPSDPDAASDAEWAAFLYLRDNPEGPFRERWNHAAGCRRWFTISRDTLTNAWLVDPKQTL
jgi:sarcosine oxidase, subunit delta